MTELARPGMGALGRGLLAGGFGTLLLNATTYADMALTGRAASSAPAETVQHTAAAVGVDLPSDDARLEAYGALGGIATGLGIGVFASLARAAGLRLPAPLAAAAVGGLAMLATDGPMSATGVSRPSEWSSADWARDAIPHLAYGAGVRWAMDWSDRQRRVPGLVHEDDVNDDPTDNSVAPSLVGLAARATALGVATGCRSSLALGGPVLAARSGRPALAAAGLVSTELVVDKVPGVASRLRTGPLTVRVLGGALGAAGLARQLEAGPAGVVIASLSGAAGACIGSVTGALWREAAAGRGWTWQAGLVEDVAALGLTVGACR